MTILKLRIHRKNDPEPIFPEFIDKIKLGEIVGVGILESGTLEGKTAIGFLIQGPDGSVLLGQLTENLFDSIVSAIRGAKQNWLENPS